jgi:hypothetical protein
MTGRKIVVDGSKLLGARCIAQPIGVKVGTKPSPNGVKVGTKPSPKNLALKLGVKVGLKPI